MLEEIYLKRRDEIDEIIKKSIKNVERNLIQIDYKNIEKNKDLINQIEENYNIKLSSICKELYLQGLKDGINLILEAKEK